MQNTLSRQHTHHFDEGNPLAQKRILMAAILTAVMMLLEVIGGWIFKSMALLADGWHMSSHMLALGLAYFAYRAARHYAHDQRFSFGTWKIEILAGYSSAILLMVVAGFMAFHSIQRLFSPVQIHYNEAIPIAILGLLVNLICAWLLHDGDHFNGSHDVIRSDWWMDFPINGFAGGWLAYEFAYVGTGFGLFCLSCCTALCP